MSSKIRSRPTCRPLDGSRKTRRARNIQHWGRGKKRPNACAIIDIDTLVDRFVPIDDGGGETVFDLWTRRMAQKKQMIALLPAGVRGDDIKRHPEWIARGAYYIDEVGFDPAESDPDVKLNTWQGWTLRTETRQLPETARPDRLPVQPGQQTAGPHTGCNAGWPTRCNIPAPR